MMPTFALPGESTPGQLGPIRRLAGWSCSSMLLTRSSSWAGMPSVIAITSSTPAAAASRMESAAKRGGTKIMLVLAPVSATASWTVSNTGTPSTSWPPFPGVTPATRSVP